MKNFLFLATSILLLNSTANAACPNEGTINNQIAQTSSYDNFKTAMDQYGGLSSIAAPGNYYKHNWSRFQTAIAQFPLQRPIVFENTTCVYNAQDQSLEYLSVVLYK